MNKTRMPLALGTALLCALPGCSMVSRFDYKHLLSRQGWQRTDRVIETLGLRPGDHVADLGAGDGYFSFPLAEAVGPTGRVYAVELDPELVAALKNEVARRGFENIEVVQGGVDDPALPDGRIDLVFLCNAYHHFEARVDYFKRLHRDLAPEGRLAIVDGRPDGAASWFIPKGHALAPGQLVAELRDAGYRHSAAPDFLPLQTFDLFAREAAQGGGEALHSARETAQDRGEALHSAREAAQDRGEALHSAAR